MKPILVTSYVNPDLDGVSCLIAYTEFLKKQRKNVVAGFIGTPHEEARYVLDRFHIPYPETFKNADEFNEVIFLDGSSPNVLEGTIRPEQIIEIIDHRPVHELDKFPNAKAQIELVGAAATLVAEKFIENKMEISKESAILLVGGIISNTFNFKLATVTSRDKEAAKWLSGIAGLSENFARELFLAKSDMTGEKLWEKMDGDFSWKIIAGKKVGMAQLEMVGAKRLVQNRLPEILDYLHTIKQNGNLDMIFLNAVDLEEEEAFLVSDEKDTIAILEKIWDVVFVGNVARRKGFVTRKQTTLLMKKLLEK